MPDLHDYTANRQVRLELHAHHPFIYRFSTLPADHLRRKMRDALDDQDADKFDRLHAMTIPQIRDYMDQSYRVDEDGSVYPITPDTFRRYASGFGVNDKVGLYLGLPSDYRTRADLPF